MTKKMLAHAVAALVLLLLLAVASVDAGRPGRRLSTFKHGIVHEAIRDHVAASVKVLAAKHPLVDVKVGPRSVSSLDWQLQGLVAPTLV
jgi:hypothetical protein